jgi:cytoskeletal protein RodZ
MPSVGEILRRERERQGLDLAQLAEQTRIRERFLQSLEADDFSTLPGKFFARSFAQQYALKLGLNAEEVGAALDRQLGVLEPEMPSLPATAAHPVPPLSAFEGAPVGGDRRWPFSVAMLVLVLAGCSGVYLLWQRYTTAGAASMALNNPPPAEPTPWVPSPTPLPATPTPTPAVDAAPPEETTATGLTPTTSASPASPVVLAPGGSSTLEITAKEDAWVEIAADGKVLFTSVLKAGESRIVGVNESARVRCGNAGGIDVRWRGSSIGQIGPRGQIRTVEFSGEKFLIVEPQKKPAGEASPDQRSVL